MAMTLKTGKDRMFIIQSYLTQGKGELRTKIRFKTGRKIVNKREKTFYYEWDNAGYMLLNEKHTKALANYMHDIIYQCGMLDEMNIIKKKSKYRIQDKGMNTNYRVKKSDREYKNPFRIVE